jgi:hypothetical protein
MADSSTHAAPPAVAGAPARYHTENDGRAAPGRLLREVEVKLYGATLRIPLPNWGVKALTASLVAGLVSVGGFKGYSYVFQQAHVPRALLDQYAEAHKHSLETREQREEKEVEFSDATRVTVIHHKSDGCKQIVRRGPSIQHADGLWMFGPTLVAGRQVSSDDQDPAAPRLSASTLIRAREGLMLAGLGSMYPAAGGASGPDVGQGRCLNPHPGPWQEQPQQVGPCAVQVWRHFHDGCVHYQLFNPCGGTWDVHPDGSPRVHWTRCVH